MQTEKNKLETRRGPKDVKKKREKKRKMAQSNMVLTSARDWRFYFVINVVHHIHQVYNMK